MISHEVIFIYLTHIICSMIRRKISDTQAQSLRTLMVDFINCKQGSSRSHLELKTDLYLPTQVILIENK